MNDTPAQETMMDGQRIIDEINRPDTRGRSRSRSSGSRITTKTPAANGVSASTAAARSSRSIPRSPTRSSRRRSNGSCGPSARSSFCESAEWLIPGGPRSFPTA